MICAIATLAIGENHQSAYEAIFKPSVERYVARHGYDLIVFDENIGEYEQRDPSLFSLMKLLAPCHPDVQGYDLLMVLDVDVLISSAAPPFHLLDLDGKIGVVDEWCQPSQQERLSFQQINGLERSARKYHHLAGFELESDVLINSGMFICQPRRHRQFFHDIFEHHKDRQRGHPRGIHFEQAMFSYELQVNGLAHLLPTAWNCLWSCHRRTQKWGPVRQPYDATERHADLRQFRKVLGENYLVHMTGGLDHDLAFVSRND